MPAVAPAHDALALVPVHDALASAPALGLVVALGLVLLEVEKEQKQDLIEYLAQKELYHA